MQAYYRKQIYRLSKSKYLNQLLFPRLNKQKVREKLNAKDN